MQTDAHKPNAIEQLRGSDVHVWLGFLQRITDGPLLNHYRALLSVEERNRESRFRFPDDRHSYLVAHAMLRIVLSRYAPTLPQEWQFATSEHGRPEIANIDASLGQLHFSLSRTHGLVVVAVTRAPAVGIDAEDILVHPAPMDVATRYFAPEEVLALRALPASQQGRRFYEYWTLKEAYVKSRGLGLLIPLNQFTCQFHGEQLLKVSMEPSLRDRSAAWKFWQFSASPRHILSICARRTPIEDQKVTCRSCIPLVHHEFFEPVAPRESA
jgi:4'-phosphopantetheinyl transferase